MNHASRISVVQGDITKLQVAAIVNAANESLLGGGGVDGAIHRAAGPELLALCRTLGGCETGAAKLTPGFRLHARFVIHTVGPVWVGGQADEEQALASCYRESLRIAQQHGLADLAFPSISTGAYGFPFERASAIALRETLKHLRRSEYPEKVVFCCFSQGDFEHYCQLVERLEGL